MKTHLTLALLFAGATFLSAQTDKNKLSNETRIRIKKIEKINGVEKITDTTILVNGPAEMASINHANFKHISGGADEDIIITENGSEMVVTSHCKDEPGKEAKSRVVIVDKGNSADLEKSEELEAEIQKALKEAMEMNPSSAGQNQVTVFTPTENGDGKKGTKQIVILRTQRLVDISEEDKKLLGKQNGVGDQQLQLNQMKFYPNPGNGKFNLSFVLDEKGDTDVTVMNVEGRTVYNEQLKNFSGAYTKEIDISSQPKGIYFVKVTQGQHSLVKKLVTE